MREIEIKLRVKNPEIFEKKLKEIGCVLSEPIYQHDANYSLRGSRNEFEKSREGDIIIRIRREKDRAEFNLKQQKSGESDNIEYESEIKDPDAIHQILLLLNWYPAVEVKKIRRKGKMGDCGVCFDQVEELGNFMELEKLVPDDEDPEKVRDELFATLEKLGFLRNDEETRGYDTQIHQLHLINKI
jgi:adenylate cyclase class 2